ncbi:conserved hypothetical protein (plasmid) [Trichormus variabilis ATCC 29413]|uniref:Uncharacterized protein n=2 Tax=Anabaena variabilis TaxID=264691 RepID=Q3M1Z1_TRIV2|nr:MULTISPECIES: hypothetical protein [Nostocaceae]ABA24995.1 conserved hypothetical protein [Trichormus variabilis ATCC 29413]MBC1217779.1 hypothetical protein [Trichormus variabilis ARAD]MBC1259059.1 hypothetical protein [Trichormus variabilis V5]MBC1270718.1 hypothetical protein [Trichormus variabilis FSR]MBC1305567.1 hypothetical protein [Trichormus variabilis N2B]
MPNWSSIKASFLALDQPHQLGELASSLAHLKSWVQSSDCQQVVPVVLEESLLYLSLIQQNTQVYHKELNQLQDILQGWQRNWDNIKSQSSQTANITNVASGWSERILDMSGLLKSESMSA